MVKLICAPMATLSHEAFRRATEKTGGCDIYFTEMINCSSLNTMGPYEKYYLYNGPVPEKIVWQLTGWNPDDFTKASQIVLEKGGLGIDINMGCSAPQIYKTGAGIAWMLKPQEETRQVLKNVKSVIDSENTTKGTDYKLSVKCRLGDEDFTESSFLSFTDMLVEEGVSTISLHPRTIKEKYRGLPRYNFAELIAKRYEKDGVKINVNGCIKDYQSASHALSICPSVDGIMIAREAAIKPWIFHEIKCQLEHAEKNKLQGTDIPYDKTHMVDREQIALDFIDDVIKYQPKEFYKTRIQRFFTYYCQQFAFGHYFQSKMLNYKSIEESIAEIKDYFVKQPTDKILYY